MTVAELIERLQQLDPAAEVRLMTQPSWPMQADLRGVAAGQDFIQPDDWDDIQPDEMDAHRAVYLVEGTHIGYGSADAWGAIG